MRARASWGLSIATLALLGACGQKGPLVLPAPAAAASAGAAPAPAGAASAPSAPEAR